MSVFFGTDGLRGIVGEELTYDIAFKCGNSLSQMMQEGRTVIIGRDTRITGSYLVSSISAGLTAGGVNVVDVGILPTAGVAYLTKELNLDYGIVITASHNPYQYNGIKVLAASGEKLQDKEEERIEKGFIKTKHVEASRVGKYVQKYKLANKYIDYLVRTAQISLEGMSVVIDASNGASYAVAPKVFKALGAKVYKINSKDDGANINVNCGSLHPERLAKTVVSKEADLGVAFDGDADRLIVVDQQGNIIDGDMVITALAKNYKAKGLLKENAVVGTSQTNMGIEQNLKESGIKLYRADVGDKYVCELMNKHGLSLGGEQSGHIIIKKYLPTGDGILSAIQLAQAVKESGKTVAEYCAVDLFPQTNVNVEVKDKLRVLGNEGLAIAISNAQQELAGKGRVLVRASGTESKVRIMVECQNLMVSRHLAEYLAGVVKQLAQEENE